MVFTGSDAPDLTESIPTPLARRITEAAQYAQSGCKFDVAVGGLPFMLAISDQRPYQRQTADFRKQQFDTSKEPGEQTLGQWWVRDQASWHRGAGVRFYEPGSDDGTVHRFNTSAGLDVWTKGQLGLLKATESIASVGSSQVCYATTAVLADGTDVVFLNANGTVKRHDGSSATTYTGATGLTRVAVAGGTVLVGTATTIASATISGSTFSSLWTAAPSAPTPYWVKGRIIASSGAALYELTLAGGNMGSQTPMYTHPDSAWTWTSVAETPSAILAAGYSGGYGAIYAFTLETDEGGTTPKLGQPFQVAEFPPGEEVHAIRVYLGTYVGIGTSRGVRIGLIGDNGSIQQGPLVVETDHPVRSLSARDSFIYAAVQDGIDGESGAVRINLAEPIDESGLRFAYASDAQAHTTGRVDSVAFLGTTDRVVIGVRGSGAYLQSDTDYEESGSVQSGFMRFATTESKAFRRVKVRTATNGGTVAISSVTRDNEAYIFTLGDSYNTDSDIAITSPTTGQPYLGFKLALAPSEDLSQTPVVEGFQLKALPQVRRQRLISYPLGCFDREADRNNIRAGYDGGAANRLAALEELEDLQAVVQVQDFTNNESFQAQIERVELERNTPPSKRGGNFGGYINLTVRRL